MRKFYSLSAIFVALLLVGAPNIQLMPEQTAGHENVSRAIGPSGAGNPTVQFIHEAAIAHAEIQSHGAPLYNSKEPNEWDGRDERSGWNERNERDGRNEQDGRNEWNELNELNELNEQDRGAGLIRETSGFQHKQRFPLQSVNGITLWDSKDQVLEKLGEPGSIVEDSLLTDVEVLYYPNMEVGIERNLVRYVAVDPAAGTIRIDGQELKITREAFAEAMGEPDFVGEDGLVYQNKQNAIKLFLDHDGDLQVIRFFHISST
ncbi:hypothetical protein [Paenibacillus senegalensis]|uniref:hypothetical protein n=1 Tax=Paenibacillus senegalensis TaxID=1465766 RepID=UPI0002882C70|nr:hypothetical protein [Paenibacillus senegalensis]